MSHEAQILILRPTAGDLQAAWERYDAAQLRTVDLYRAKSSTAEERRAAVVETARLHTAFTKLLARAGEL